MPAATAPLTTTIDGFTRTEVLRIVGITPSQLGYWERLQLVHPQRLLRKKVYTFGDLVSLRTVKQLKEQRVPAGQVRRAVHALRQQLAEVQSPLTELRIRPSGSRVAIEYRGVTVEPISGQLLFNFGGLDDPALRLKVSAMPDRSLEEWFRMAIECENLPELRVQAVEAYQRVLEKAPDSVEAHINLGTLLYEQGDLAAAAAHYRNAVRISPGNPLAHFNLGTALEDAGDLDAAHRHLSQAVRLAPHYADAHYNLARVCEKTEHRAEARHHWQRYLQLEPHSPWAKYARQRLVDEPDNPRKP